MAAPRPWTDDDTARLAQLHAEGKSLHAVAREMGRSKGTISKYADKAGLAWDRTATKTATEARVADARERRARLQVGLLEDAERLRAQLFAECKVFNFGGKDNTYEERTLEKPPFADQLKIVQATGNAIDRALKLDLHDSAAGAAQVTGLLQATARALGLDDGQGAQE